MSFDSLLFDTPQQWSTCQPTAHTGLELLLRKQKLVMWFESQCGSHRLYFVNEKTWISLAVQFQSCVYSLSNEHLWFHVHTDPSSFCCWKQLEIPMCVWKAVFWLWWPKVLINIKQRHRQLKTSLLLLVLAVPLALRYLMREQTMFLSSWAHQEGRTLQIWCRKMMQKEVLVCSRKTFPHLASSRSIIADMRNIAHKIKVNILFLHRGHVHKPESVWCSLYMSVNMHWHLCKVTPVTRSVAKVLAARLLHWCAGLRLLT